ncbi:MAG TPA: tetratricopeptide repeat protein [Gaiellaceae bacterium]|nr:tetratricopeptide repeat protein [Gaiellaceae bacterium]
MTTPQVTHAPSRARGSRLGERLRQLRVSAGLTQSELAGDRFSKEYVSQIERGKTRPTQETIEWLATRLGVDAGFLASGVSADERTRVEAAIARAEGLTEGRNLDEETDELEKLRAAVAATGVPELELRARSAEARALWFRGDVRAAAKIFEQLRGLVEAPSFSDLDRAEIVYRLGVCRYQISSISTATTLLDEALKLADASGHPCDGLRSQIFYWRSRCRQRQRDWEAAREDVELALELAQGVNDRRGLAHLYLQASLIAERDGHWVLARSHAERAKAIFEELADRVHVGVLLNNLGGLQFLLGKPDDAVAYLKDSFAVALEVGEDVEAGRAVSSLAQVHLRTGKPELAEEQAQQALQLLDGRVDHLDEIGNVQLVLGRALLDQGRLDDAEQALDLAESTLQQLGSASHNAAAWVAKGDLAQARGDQAGAARLYKRAAEALQDFRF